MKRITIIITGLLSAGAVNAQPYVSASFMGTAPEVAAGYSMRWLDLEIGTLGERQLGAINRINTFEEWTVRGNRLTAKLRAPLAAKVDLLFGASAYGMRYTHEFTATPTESRKEHTWGASVGVQYRMNERLSVQAEHVYIDTPPEAFNLPNVNAMRIGLSLIF